MNLIIVFQFNIQQLRLSTVYHVFPLIETMMITIVAKRVAIIWRPRVSYELAPHGEESLQKVQVG